jgi:hypothetical protein
LLSKGLPTAVLLIGVGALLVQNLFDLGSEIPALMIALCTVLGALFSSEEAGEWPGSADWRGRGLVIVGLGVLVLSVLWIRPARAVEIREQLYRERSQLVGSERDGFVQQVHAALRQYPADPYLILLGAHAAGDPARAMRFVNWALERDPNHGPAHLFAAELLWSLGARTQALFELRLAASSWPSLKSEVAHRRRIWTGEQSEAQQREESPSP